MVPTANLNTLLVITNYVAFMCTPKTILISTKRLMTPNTAIMAPTKQVLGCTCTPTEASIAQGKLFMWQAFGCFVVPTWNVRARPGKA